jgi:HAD superfamily hydrolase (TIGR01509 family)
MTLPKLVIFDCDGVLVDSEPVSNAALVRNLARHGLTVTIEDCLRDFVGGTMQGVMDKVIARGTDLPANWVDEIYAEIYDALRGGVDVVSGIPDLLDHLDRAGVPFCVASNGSPTKMDITLGQTGLAPRFADARYSAHEVGIAKPDPGLFLHAASQAGVAPADCVVVEDSASGAEAARRAGMRCFGYAAHDDGARLAAEGAEVISDMGQVAGRIGLKVAAE